MYTKAHGSQLVLDAAFGPFQDTASFRILQITYSGSSQVFAICNSFSSEIETSEIENTTAPTDSQVNEVLD